MKKIDTQYIINPTRRFGGAKATLDHLQESFTEALAAFFKGVTSSSTDPIILYGCVNSGVGLHFILSAGAIFLDGEYYEIDAADFTAAGGQTAVLSIVTTYRGTDPAKYSDGNHFDTHSIRKLFWAAATAGSGLGDFGDCVSMASVLPVPPGLSSKVDKAGDTMSGELIMGGNTISGLPTPRLPYFFPTAATNVAANKNYVDLYLNRSVYDSSATASNAMSVPFHMGSNPIKNVGTPTASNDAARKTDVDTVATNLATEASTRSTADGTLQTNITTEENTRIAADSALNSAKANVAQAAWTNITLINSWVAVGAATPQYRVDTLGRWHLRGVLDASGASNDVFATFPAPVKENRIPRSDDSGGWFANLLYLVGGDMSISPRDIQLWSLDGISFWVD